MRVSLPVCVRESRLIHGMPKLASVEYDDGRKGEVFIGVHGILIEIEGQQYELAQFEIIGAIGKLDAKRREKS